MVAIKRSIGLGRGLNAIFDTEDIVIKGNITKESITTGDGIDDIAIDEIVANSAQPRKLFDDNLLVELADSIKALGVIQPITLRKEEGGKYTIISGERRHRASKIAGLTHIPAYIRKVDDNTMLEMALVENIQREELTSMEIALTLNRLIEECDITQEELANKVGKKRSTISNYIRLLKLPAEVQLSISEGVISMGHAKAIMSVEGVKKQITLLKKIVEHHLSVRQTEEFAKKMMAVEDVEEQKKQSTEEEYPDSYSQLVEHLEMFFNQEISIKKSSKGSGKIVIGFNSDTEIEEIIQKFATLK